VVELEEAKVIILEGSPRKNGNSSKLAFVA